MQTGQFGVGADRQSIWLGGQSFGKDNRDDIIMSRVHATLTNTVKPANFSNLTLLTGMARQATRTGQL